jgi:hypothetical protein
MNRDRISLLLSWASVSGDTEFMTHARQIAEKPLGGFSPWRDGVELVSLIRNLPRGEDTELPSAGDLATELEDCLVAMLRGHIWPDDLDRMME